MRLLGALVLCQVLLGSAAADEAGRNRTSGLAVGAGFGYQVPVLGGELRYHLGIARRWWLVPHFGAGIWPQDRHVLPGIAGGVMGAWGERHRIVADLGLGLVGALGYRSVLTGNVVEVHPLYGLTAGLGYEFIANGGFWIAPMLGLSYSLDDPPSGSSRWSPTLSLTAGYKIW